MDATQDPGVTIKEELDLSVSSHPAATSPKSYLWLPASGPGVTIKEELDPSDSCPAASSPQPYLWLPRKDEPTSATPDRGMTIMEELDASDSCPAATSPQPHHRFPAKDEPTSSTSVLRNERKRKRQPNFTKAEEELLVELVRKKKHVLENKRTDALMWKQKERSWMELGAEFNSERLLVTRTVEQLQLKYKSLKKLVRKKSAIASLEKRKTDGGSEESQPLNDTEKKIKDMILVSVEGQPPSYDCGGSGSMTFDMLDVDTTIGTEQDIEVTVSPLDHVIEGSGNDTAEEIEVNAPSQSPQATCTSTTQPQDIMQQPRWDVRTPRHLQQNKSNLLRLKKQRYKSRSTEATNILQRKDETLNLQKICLEQEVELNKERKTNLLLDRDKINLEIQKIKLEIQLLQNKVNEPRQ